jgi:hypothetical protein
VSAYAQLVASIDEEARRRHSGWNARLFDEIARTRGAELAAALGDGPDAHKAVAGYLRLTAEALGLGYVSAADVAALGEDAHLLARCIADVLPRRLPAYPSPERLGLLARTWNLGEGLLRQPPWMARVVAALVPDLDDLAGLDRLVEQALEPLLTPSRRSAFAGPFAIETIDLRALDEDFLPGAVHAAAPAVICVHDRRRKGRHAAVMLRSAQGSRALGLTRCLGHAELWTAGPELELAIGSEHVAIGNARVELWSVQTVQGSVLVPSGFAVVTAADSQRLWVMESQS